MDIFTTIPIDSLSAQFLQDGYVHVINGITDTFLSYARSTACRFLRESREPLHFCEVPGKKLQYLFDWPDEESEDIVLRTTADIAGLSKADVVLSERHIKVYLDTAPSFPPLHKDRFASKIAVGIPLIIGKRSRLALLTGGDRSINTSDHASYWKPMARTTDAAGTIYAHFEGVKLYVRPHDFIVFAGSSIYHERICAAGSVVLYLKCNDMGLDPLSESTAMGSGHSA